jgi:dimethylamine corrinoid protein
MLDPGMTSFVAAVIAGDSKKAVAEAEQLRIGGISSEYIVTHGLESAMTALDAKCTLEQFNLLEIMLAGRAVMEVMKILYPAGVSPVNTRGTIVIATLEGDVHDLGKNILKMVLTARGYRVLDCGKDCSLQKLMDTIESESPVAVGISGLITPVIPHVKQVKDWLARRKLDHVKVIAGGAALKQSSAGKLNVDFVAESAFDCVHYLEGSTGGVR